MIKTNTLLIDLVERVFDFLPLVMHYENQSVSQRQNSITI